MSVLWPVREVSSKTLLGERSLLVGVKARARCSEACPLEARQLFKNRRLYGLAAVRETPLLNKPINFVEEISLKRHRNF